MVESQTNKTKSGSKKTLLIILGVSLGLLIVGGILFYFFYPPHYSCDDDGNCKWVNQGDYRDSNCQFSCKKTSFSKCGPNKSDEHDNDISYLNGYSFCVNNGQSWSSNRPIPVISSSPSQVTKYVCSGINPLQSDVSTISGAVNFDCPSSTQGTCIKINDFHSSKVNPTYESTALSDCFTPPPDKNLESYFVFSDGPHVSDIEYIAGDYSSGSLNGAKLMPIKGPN